MKKTVIVVIAILLSISVASAEDVQIGSFNIKYLGDGINDQNPREDFDLKKLAQIIDLLDLELVSIVEVENKAALDKLVVNLPKDENGDPVYDDKIGQSGGKQRIGIIFKKDEISFLDGPKELSELQEAWTSTKDLFPRLPLYAYIRAGTFDFHFIALHLKAMFDFDSIKRRERELEKLRDWVEAKLSSDKDVVIVGDMNEVLGSAPFAKLNENNKFYFCTSELSCEYSYIGIKSLIDHIIVSKVSGGSKVEYVERSIRVFPTDILLKHLYGNLETLEDRLSDHRLIFCTFKTDN